MAQPLHFLIVDGYPKVSRDELEAAGMKLAWQLYLDMARRFVPDVAHTLWLPSDNPELPDSLGPEHYAAVMWTGCNLTIYHHDDQRVQRQLTLCKRAYEVGTPQFGTCWGLQMAAVAAGGEVKANPRGREMGLGRKIHVTDEGRHHPLLTGKPPVYCGFISHLDEVTALPPGGQLLASNDFTHVQAIEVKHGQGAFWATQYHPEYDLHELARLIVAREPKLVPEKFFVDHADLVRHVERLEALHQDPARKDLRWQLDIDDDVLDPDLRQREVKNWIDHLVKPHAAQRG